MDLSGKGAAHASQEVALMQFLLETVLTRYSLLMNFDGELLMGTSTLLEFRRTDEFELCGALICFINLGSE